MAEQQPVKRESQLQHPRRSWDPIERLREAFSWEPFGGMVGREGYAFSPAFEVKEANDAIVITADMPGVEESDLDVSMSGDRLTISGKRESEKSEEGDRFYTYERSYGAFTRSFTLPGDVNSEAASAELKNGVFKLTLPKLPESKAKKIKVGGSGGQGQKVRA